MTKCSFNDDIYHDILCSSHALIHWITLFTLLFWRHAAVSETCRLKARLASPETWLHRPPAATTAATKRCSQAPMRPTARWQRPTLWQRMKSLLWKRSSAAWSAKVGPVTLRVSVNEECEIRGATLLCVFGFSYIHDARICSSARSFTYVTQWT